MNHETGTGKSLPKLDSLALAAGTEPFCDDFDRPGTLTALQVGSPHAFAEITSIDTREAEQEPGVAAIYDYRNTTERLYTTAGQGFPEPSPYDCRLFSPTLRFYGDRVALIVANSEAAARRAAKRIRVDYKLLEPNFDLHRAEERATGRLHGEDAHAAIPVPYRPEDNLAAELAIDIGDCRRGFDEAEESLDHSFTMQYASHCAMEPHTCLAYTDGRGRLIVITATQVPFHVRRIIHRLLEIPLHQIRVIKPRIGGGFGGKQEVLLEPLAALAAWDLKKPVRLRLTRREVFTVSRTRHEMACRIRTGFDRDGTIRALDMEALMNAGAYGSHALTVLSNAGAKVLPLFNKIPNIRFSGRSVYTNLPVGGAYRGYGATQGYFAFNQIVDMIACRCGIDFIDLVKQNHIRRGETSPIFEALGEGKEGVSQSLNSCALEECLDQGAAAIGWKRKGKSSAEGPKRRGIGAAVCMQGSGIPLIDMGACSMKINEDGSFNLSLGATDIGTGSDTVLAQIASEVLMVPVEKFIVRSSDTDTTPFDVGAYASSTTYVSGNAVLRCAETMKEKLRSAAAAILQVPESGLCAGEESFLHEESGRIISYSEIAYQRLYSSAQEQLECSASYTGTESPPPFLAQFAEIDVDIETGVITVLRFVSVADCGRALNPMLARGQIEGAVVNGLSYALTEEYLFNKEGRMTNPSLGQYKIFNTLDIPEMETIIVPSHEESGPMGAKSIGEIAINGAAPAIANALYDATGRRLFSTPFTPEKVWRALQEAPFEA